MLLAGSPTARAWRLVASFSGRGCSVLGPTLACRVSAILLTWLAFWKWSSARGSLPHISCNSCLYFLTLHPTGCSATDCNLLDTAFKLRFLRFLTDPDVPGVEKLAIWTPTDAWLEQPYEPLPHLDAGGLEKTNPNGLLWRNQVGFKCPCAVCRRDAHTVQRRLHQRLETEPSMFDLLRRDQAAGHHLRGPHTGVQGLAGFVCACRAGIAKPFFGVPFAFQTIGFFRTGFLESDPCHSWEVQDHQRCCVCISRTPLFLAFPLSHLPQDPDRP